MAKNRKDSTFTVDSWLNLADDSGVQRLIETDPYSRVYPALVGHFHRQNCLNWDAALVGLHIVYGWMPTIPELKDITKYDADQQENIIGIIDGARKGTAPNVEQMETLSKFTNNSVIGSSKLLHFINPEICPIWDQRVARVFLWPGVSFGSVNQAQRWTEYQETLTRWQDDQRVKDACGNLRKLAECLKDVSNLRLTELVMFHASDPDATKDEK
jgi:Family of unknown function (DUF6308)